MRATAHKRAFVSERSLAAMSALVLALSVLATRAQHTPPDEPDFTLVNAGTAHIVHLYISVSTVDNWQEEILGQDVLNPGDAVNIHLSPSDADAGSCLYDIRVHGADGSQGFLWAVDLCSTSTVTLTS